MVFYVQMESRKLEERQSTGDVSSGINCELSLLNI